MRANRRDTRSFLRVFAFSTDELADRSSTMPPATSVMSGHEPWRKIDQETDVDDPLLNRRDVAVLLPGSPPRSRHLVLLAIGGRHLAERERLGMRMRQRPPEAERGGDALKRTDAPVHLAIEQLDVEHLRFLAWIEPLQLGP